tara:strand:+ start:179 stop:472 length:294 start_codon:yes stop_codon:yes gene_type:complete
MKNKKQLKLFSALQLGKKTNVDLKTQQLSDEAVKNILPKLQLVSSKQLALILSKKNDDGLRVARCENRGFSWYKDKDGNVYYNLPEVMREIGIGINK